LRGISKRICADANRVESESGEKSDEAVARLNALPTGQGRVWITGSRVTHSHDNVVAGNGAVEWMQFSVEINLASQKTKE
jgi:hypothetical protein